MLSCGIPSSTQAVALTLTSSTSPCAPSSTPWRPPWTRNAPAVQGAGRGFVPGSGAVFAAAILGVRLAEVRLDEPDWALQPATDAAIASTPTAAGAIADRRHDLDRHMGRS